MYWSDSRSPCFSRFLSKEDFLKEFHRDHKHDDTSRATADHERRLAQHKAARAKARHYQRRTAGAAKLLEWLRRARRKVPGGTSLRAQEPQR